jgi:capsular polysaccharide biosynthesis protein
VPSAFHSDLYLPKCAAQKINSFFIPHKTHEAFPRTKQRYLILRKGRRKFKEERDLVEALQHYNFSTIYLEDYDLNGTVSLFQTAEIVVGAHGAGLVNVLFSGNVKLVEIGVEKSSLLFPVLASQLGFQHFLYVGSHDEEADTISIDVGELILCLLERGIIN